MKLEFWPDYDGALLWTAGGERASLDDLSLPDELVDRARRWVAEYADSKLPWEPTVDEAWLSEGRRLFAALKAELVSQGVELEPNEEFWAELPLGRRAKPEATGTRLSGG